MSTDIPRARDILRSALLLGDPQEKNRKIAEALSLMTRRVRSTDRTIARRVTSEMVRRVNEDVAKWPDVTDVELATKYGVNPGRINEIRNGLRTEENPQMKRDRSYKP